MSSDNAGLYDYVRFGSSHRRILLDKLEHYRVRHNELNWSKSYFFARLHFVEYSKFKSSLITFDYGIPQGRIIGPLLLIISIKDKIKCVPNA